MGPDVVIPEPYLNSIFPFVAQLLYGLFSGFSTSQKRKEKGA